jgi:hypothetical protein
MFSRINLFRICVDHFQTLKDTGEKSVDKGQVFLFILIPVLASGLILYFFSGLGEKFIEILITAMSILTGLLFNLIVLLYDIINKAKDDFTKATAEEGGKTVGHRKLRLEFLKQIFANISFGIFLALFCIPFLVLGLVKEPHLKMTSDFISLSFLLMFFLLMMMILKRVHILLANEFAA